ncbi:MAG: 7-cyano-7-deazaguanine synthase QueC [Actinomyces sp.]|jgi:7-cyano-7-deazaguanine synthase|nr:7-cyano-7-deazaguanine synthase QueC [Actinomyces sp.]MCI1661720.1 7-cyano-7-deazaguanine synthase QueC [Actinomyces sp.]MCI1690468.1 7-cyano-7-deazaguanine synthase QueC [Actinomyces sp.]MCI1786446.1 7-cyano-7-deazaguanine synthase QueC [Actinomyces sp.]MCI1866148.1 7-cyano-7-deazaguanine synthase QueC [Actinomyces sp.]
MALASQETDLALAVSVDYGQRHIKELDSARRVADVFGTPLMVLDLSAWGRSLRGSALTDRSVQVPLNEYDVQSMSVTVVPNRNATMLMAAAGVAESQGIDEVWAAVHSGDHAIYADCRPEFIESAARTMALGTEGRVALRAPFVTMSKADVVTTGAKLGAPFELTWSCYQGGEVHCGRCGTCRERADAFRSAGVKDPTRYLEV